MKSTRERGEDEVDSYLQNIFRALGEEKKKNDEKEKFVWNESFLDKC